MAFFIPVSEPRPEALEAGKIFARIIDPDGSIGREWRMLSLAGAWRKTLANHPDAIPHIVERFAVMTCLEPENYPPFSP